MATKHPHIFLPDIHQSEQYTRPRQKIPEADRPRRNRRLHGEKIAKQLAAIWAKAKQGDGDSSSPPKGGVYVEFEGAPGFELVTKSLEDRPSGIRLLTVYTAPSESDPSKQVQRATVFVPSGKEKHYTKKVRQYVDEETEKGAPKHAKLVASIERVHPPSIGSFWRDDPELLPKGKSSVWCELWLRDIDEAAEPRFRAMARSMGIELRPGRLHFPERTVVLGKTTAHQLTRLIEESPYIAEFRRAKETSRFFLELGNAGQTDWVDDLRYRLQTNQDPDVSVCILDTGANNGHPLLADVLADSDRHAVEPEWGSHDHHGHGTLMCGVAAFGDVLDALQHDRPIRIDHCLESSKILPPHATNPPELYGDVTRQGVSRAEIEAPDRSRVICMAVTSKDGRDKGRPSSWSAAIDQLTSGFDDDDRRLFIVASGNNLSLDDDTEYPTDNLDESVHDPGQSWNALTIGAYTCLTRLTDPDLVDHVPMADTGQLSPFSSTSTTWDTKWPIKPELLCEGGNVAIGPDGFVSEHDDLSPISTDHQPHLRLLSPFNATSAASAQAAWMAARIQSQYPDAWPETVRGLMIHTASWPDAMKAQFLGESTGKAPRKSDFAQLLRICGYGVPNLNQALACTSNSLTLIAQSELQPFTKKEGRSACSTKDMHVYELPWPEEVLLSLGALEVTVRVTLSYFIEPSPGEVGWKDKYRYSSHGLRFDMNSQGEDHDLFLKRLNAAAREEGESNEGDSNSKRWLIGSTARNVGSIHSDIWTGTAAEIATCNMVGVYPVIGWWRERAWLQRWNRMARYSLIVSIHTPEENVDIYTPVAQKLRIPITVTT